MADPTARLTAALAERYQIQRELGAGGMATVYLAQDVRHHRDVAVKVLRPELAQTLGPERFLREIEIAAGLHHPHILPLYDSGEADGFLFYVMPYEEGRSLRDRLAREGELPIPEAVRILRDVVDALAHAHHHGVVHRDIKPENILLSGHHALVTDFGVAKAVSEATGRYQLTTTGVALGTPAYMAPEQAAADPHLDQRADIYAVGIVAYEILTGQPPFPGRTPQEVLVAHMTATPDPVTAHRSAIPAPLAALVMKCLEKNRADRWQSAEDLLPQLEAMLTPSGGITPVETTPVRARRRPHGRWAIPVAAVSVVALAALAAVLLRRESTPALDSTLLAVAPFDVLSPQADLAVWGEGMMDLLSRSLDGAGPIRTLAPSVAVRRWSGRADATSAEAFGRRTGAGLAVFGTLVAIGGDSARAAATLLDVATGAVMAEQEVRDRADRVDRLADSLAVRLLSDLSRTRNVGATRLRSVGSGSPGAIKAFLRGQQHYRRSSWDSAKAYFERAVALDSTFALAHRGIGQAAGWNEALVGSEALRALEIRAGDLNRGLAPRESLLVLADSLWAGLTPEFDGQWSRMERLFGVLETATRRYPEDPEVWYELGESRFHFGSSAGVTVEAVKAAFDRAIQLDPGFTPAYIHMAELGFMLEGRAGGERALEGVLAAHPMGAQGGGSLLARRLVDPATAESPDVAAMLDTLSPEAFRSAFDPLMRFPDSAESAIRVARAWVARAPTGAAYLRGILAFRGHLGESLDQFASGWREPSSQYWGTHSTFLQLAALGAIPDDSAGAVFADWLTHRYGPGVYLATAWWADHRDTLSLATAVRFYADRARLTPERTAADSALWRWAQDCTESYTALARGDTTDALRRFAALRDWPWVPRGYVHRLRYAQLLAARGQDREAAAVLDRVAEVGSVPGPLEVSWMLERARVNERLGDRDKAARDYSYVIDVWRHADDLLQPFVEEARQGVARLVREPRRD